MSKSRMTKEQRKWVRDYKMHTSFEALMDDFEAGNESFYEAARKSISWFEDWSSDAHLKAGANIPGEDDELMARISEGRRI